MSINMRTVIFFCAVSACASVNETLAFETSVAGSTASIGNGFTGGSHPEGSHFHSSNLATLPPGNPAIIFPGAAEVGGFFGDEEVRGVSEFGLRGAADVATLHFDVLDVFAEQLSPEPNGVDGLFGQGPFVGVINVWPYAADGVEAISDYEAPVIGELPILAIEVGPDLVSGGDSFSVDVTQIYNDLVSEDRAAMGVRLQMADADADAGAITFHNFRLDLSQAAVPEPSSVVLLLSGLCCVGLGRRSRSRA